MPPNSRNSPQASHTTTILFFLLILLAFFPGIFHYFWTLPLGLLPAFLSANPLSRATTSPRIIDSDPSAAVAPTVTMGSWYQKQFTLPSKSRGSYLITDHVVSSLPEIKNYKIGLLNLFIQHTSCALSLNENWDDDVRADMSDALDRIAPEEGPKGEELYRHSAGKHLTTAASVQTADSAKKKSNITEGSDDMPAHVKSALIGASVTIPIRDGKLATGM